MHQYRPTTSPLHERNGRGSQPRRFSRGYISAIGAFLARLMVAVICSALMSGVVLVAAWILGANLQSAAPLMAVAGAMGFVAAMAELRD